MIPMDKNRSFPTTFQIRVSILVVITFHKCIGSVGFSCHEEFQKIFYSLSLRRQLSPVPFSIRKRPRRKCFPTHSPLFLCCVFGLEKIPSVIVVECFSLLICSFLHLFSPVSWHLFNAFHVWFLSLLKNLGCGAPVSSSGSSISLQTSVMKT